MASRSMPQSMSSTAGVIAVAASKLQSSLPLTAQRMSDSISSRGSRRSNGESSNSRGSSSGARPHQSPQSSTSDGTTNTKRTNHKSSSSPNNRSHNASNRRAPPAWCFVPPKEGQSTMKTNVTLFGKTVTVYWCPHHERWDTHRLQNCPTEIQLQSYKQQLDIFFISRKEVLETQEKLMEAEQKIKNQKIRLAVYEQKLRDAGVHKPNEKRDASFQKLYAEDAATGNNVPLKEHMNREEQESLKAQLHVALEELETTRNELSESQAKLKKQRYKRKSNRNGDSTEGNSDELEDLQRRLDETERISENRKNRILQTESRYKECKEQLKEEQEKCMKCRKQLEELEAENKQLERKLLERATLNGGSPQSVASYERREEADKSIYRLSESLATVTGALESERAARMTLEKEFAIERKEYEEKLREAQAEVVRANMLLTAKRQTSTTSTGSFRSNGNYIKICRLLVYSHHMVSDERVQLIKEAASNCSIGGFVKGGQPGLIAVEGLEEDCDSFLNALAEQHRKLRKSPRKNGKVDSATFAAAGKIMSQAETMEEGRAFPKELTQLDSENGLDDLKALCASTGMLDLIDEVCKR